MSPAIPSLPFPRSALIAVSARAVAVARGAGGRPRAHWAIDGDLAAALQRVGAAVSLLPPPSDADRLDRHARRCLADADGLLLQGGGDVRLAARIDDPISTAPGRSTDQIRDAWELALLEAALDRGIPILGICRGLHVINVVRGGSLCLDCAGGQDLTLHDDRLHYGARCHRVALSADGVLRTICAADALWVRSAHRHAIGRIGRGLVVEAVADDGCIEAVRAVDHDWLVGVQWHPEMAEGRAERAHSQLLLAHFVGQCVLLRGDAGVVV